MANFIQFWHKASLFDGYSSLLKCRVTPFSEGRWLWISENTLIQFENLLLQNHLAYFNQTWHKASLGDGTSILFKWRAKLLRWAVWPMGLLFFFSICDFFFKIVKTDSTTADARRYVASVWTMSLVTNLRENAETDAKLILSLLCVKVCLFDPAGCILCFNNSFFSIYTKRHIL